MKRKEEQKHKYIWLWIALGTAIPIVILSMVGVKGRHDWPFFWGASPTPLWTAALFLWLFAILVAFVSLIIDKMEIFNGISIGILIGFISLAGSCYMTSL